MFFNIYREKFNGLGIGRIERNENFTANLGYYHNEYQIQYIFHGERLFFYDGICYRMTEGSMAFIDKKQIVKTCVLGNHYHDRLLIELEEEYFSPLCDMLEFNLSTFFDQHQGVYFG